MPCPDYDELERLATGDLPAEQADALRAHVSACTDCAERWTDVSENLEVASRAQDLGVRVPAEPEMRERIGPFRIVRELGRGGMGIVYLAEQETPRREVALKILHPGASGSELRRRFRHEANLLAQLRHPGIAQVYESGTADGRPYLAMEHVDGERLDRWVQDRRPDEGARLRLLARVADAVHHAHLQGIVHRDLKPANVLVVREPGGAEPRPKVLDFGVARATDADLQTLSLPTEAGRLLGTVPFMSPEQILGDSRRIDARSDVYSLGVLAYWMLAERLPYDLEHRSLAESARIIRDDDPAPLSSVAPRHRGDLETIVSKALAKDPELRYQSASELAADLRRFLADEPIVARAPSAAYQLRKFARRNRTLVAAAAAVGIALVGGAAVSSWLAVRAVRAERAAREQLARAETAAAKQRAVSDFLLGMLSSADPYRTEGDRATTVLEALDHAAEALDAGRFADQPDLEFAVRSTLGNTYWSVAAYEPAERQLRAALAAEPSSPEDPVKALGDLGLLLAETNRYAEAEETFREQHRRAIASLGPGHALTAGSLGNLAGVMADQGRLAEAESTLVRALEVSARLAGEDRAIHASNLHTLGGLRYFRGDLDGAEAAFRECAAVDRGIFGPDHPEAFRSLEALGAVAGRKGDHREQARLNREILDRTRDAFGDDHPRVATALGNLGIALLAGGKPEEAEELLRRSVEMSRRLKGTDHRETARALNDLAQVLRRRGRDEEAAPLYAEAAAIQERVLGPDHPWRATTLFNLARLHADAGRSAPAESLLEVALRIRRDALGEGHEATHEIAAELARVRGE
jgi:tetratricopeptide (TPR) repeat protein/predicted Ser/Thr protein kinase